MGVKPEGKEGIGRCTTYELPLCMEFAKDIVRIEIKLKKYQKFKF